VPFFVVEYLNRPSAIAVEELHLNADSLAQAEALAGLHYASICRMWPEITIHGFHIRDANLDVVRPFKPESVSCSKVPEAHPAPLT